MKGHDGSGSRLLVLEGIGEPFVNSNTKCPHLWTYLLWNTKGWPTGTPFSLASRRTARDPAMQTNVHLEIPSGRQIEGYSIGDSSSSFCLIHFCQVNHLLISQSCKYSIQLISPWVLIVQVLLSNSYFLYEFDFQIILLGLIFLQCFFLSYH